MKTPRARWPNLWNETRDLRGGAIQARGHSSMQRKHITLLSLGAAALLGTSGAIALPVGPGEGRHGSGGFRGHGRFLELTEDQQASAREIFEGQRPQREALHQEMRENRQLVRESLESDQPDALLVGELMIEGQALKKRSRALREESKKALESILSDEQKQKLELFESMRGPKGHRGMMGPGGMMGRHGGRWGPPGRGPAPE